MKVSIKTVCIIIILLASSILFISGCGGTTTVEGLVLEKMGVMYVGGKTVEPQEGQTEWIEQVPVHYLIPANVTRDLPVIMIPGMGLTSSIYLSTPDGRDGWATIFAEAGFEVYVMDEPNNAVSSFNVIPFDEVESGDLSPSEMPGFTKWNTESSWSTWGMGETYPTPFEDSLFPAEYAEEFFKSITPVYSEGMSDNRFGWRQKAPGLAALLGEVGPAIVICHSASGKTAFEAMKMEPHLMKGLVAIEPAGVPSNEDDFLSYMTEIGDIPFLSMHGDYFNPWRTQQEGNQTNCQNVADVLSANGGSGQVIDLPDVEGIVGNSHLMMIDNNNDDLADMIIDWLNEHVFGQ
ncbi:hypothetical protein ACFLXN_02940 [Chloroflexota bacterium]